MRDAASRRCLRGQSPREVTIVTGRGELLQFERDIERVAISEPKIADAVVVSPREIMVNAKAPGKATAGRVGRRLRAQPLQRQRHQDNSENESFAQGARRPACRHA